MAKKTERVFLIDSMSHIFRAFFAPMQNRAAPLATSQGFVTQAVYIFTNMLLKLLREEKPDYIAAIGLSKHLSPTRSNGLTALLAGTLEWVPSERIGDLPLPPCVVPTVDGEVEVDAPRGKVTLDVSVVDVTELVPERASSLM